MKALFTLFFSTIIFISAYSQNTIWGTTKKGGQYNCGYIYRTDSIGDHLTIVHHFNEPVDGKAPGPIIQASNGKLYGMTTLGGNGVVPIPGPNSTTITTLGGTLFEYDPVLDNFTTLHHFNSTDPQYPFGFSAPSTMKILEATPGKLWCVFNVTKPFGAVSSPAPRYILSYTIATNSMAAVGILPSWTTPVAPGSTFNTAYTGELYKAANGFIYGTTDGYSACATTSHPSWGTMGSVIRIHPTTYAFVFIRPFPCSATGGKLPESNLVEAGGKLYSATRWGGPATTITNFGDGVIFEFDPVTNVYTEKYNLPGGVGGEYPIGNMIKANNGKIYGATYGGTPYPNFPNGSGVLYEYDAATNTHTKKQDFTDGGAMDIGKSGSLWLKAHSGKLYGTTENGLFEYNVVTNQMRAAGRFNNQLDIPNPLTEICRKPAYNASATHNYTICTNSFFSYAINCSNATTFVWTHNGSPDPSQTTATLSFSNIAIANAGTWICTMTNDCGTTTAPTLSLTVNTAGTGVVTSTIVAAGSTSICPGSNITLTGNTGGVWNTGSTNAGITISQPGAYQVTNTNACGQTFSNIITIDTIPTPFIPVITFTPTGTYSNPQLGTYVCPGDSALLTGNTSGIWNTGEATPSIYVKDNLPHYVISANQCTTVTSATAQVIFVVPPPTPVIAQTGTIQVCQSDSALLTATTGTLSTVIYWYRMVGSTYHYINVGNSLYAKVTGNYYAMIIGQCGNVYSQPVFINADTLALDTAIISASGTLTFCPGGSVTLTSNNSNCLWSTGQTTHSITVNQSGNYYVTNSNSCSSAVSAIASVSVISTPTISYIEPQVPVCLTTPAFTLAAGNPTGGSYSGTGVTGNTFDPVLAGSGTHTVTYSFFDSNTGCSSIATQSIYVEYNPTVILAAPSTSICQGNTATLIQTNSNGAVWNTGQTGPVLTTTVAGSYYVTQTNGCGNIVNSNTIQITYIPLPATPTITQNGTVLQASAGQAYQWYFNGGTIVGATSQTYAPTQDGNYTVYVSGPNGCYALSAQYPFVVTGIAAYNNSDLINLYPNPTSGNVVVNVPAGKTKITVTNSVGQIVAELYTEDDREIKFQLHNNGIYVVEIIAGNERYIKKLVVDGK